MSTRNGIHRYRMIILTLMPLIALYTLYRSLKDGGVIYLQQRFGFALPQNTANATWLHCASVGEINTALPLIQALASDQPSTRFIVSTTTPTAKNVLLTKTCQNITHFYLPLDISFAVKRCLNKLRPERLILMETEIWPNLIRHCYSRQIGITIVNARLSAKTMNTYSWLLTAYANSLQKVHAVYAKNKAEGDKYLTLGLPVEALHIVGSLKFAAISSKPHATADLPTKPYCLAASTHDDEELRIASEWVKNNRKELLVIAPRHPERRARIQKQLNAIGTKTQLRSQQKALLPDTQVYIADTLGELDAFIQEALAVFVGGSLIPRGGHNIIEAARAGKVVIIGPSIENFIDEFQWLEENNAIIQVDTEQQVIEQFCSLLNNNEQRKELEQNALHACVAQSDIIHRYVALLTDIPLNRPA